MKKVLLLVGLVGSLSVSSVASGATSNYVADLSGAQEMPKVTTSATGTATVTFDDATNKLTGTLTMTGISDVGLAHLHSGTCGNNGAIAHTLTGATSSSVPIDVTLSSAQATALVAQGLYLNIHTAAHGDGEIRGQLRPAGSANTCTGGPTTVPTDGGGKTTTDSGAGSSSGGGTAADDGGCTTSGNSDAGGGLLLALAAGFGLAALGRRRRRR